MNTSLTIALISLSICARLVAIEPASTIRGSEPSPAGSKPVMNIDSRYPLIDESIRNGQFGDIRPNMIYRYGYPFQRKIEGKHYWLVPVRYFAAAPSASIYTQSRIVAEAYACINHDQVKFWIPKYSQRFGL